MSRGYSHHAIGRADPDSGEVKYIGKSEKPSSRLSAHKSRSAATYVRPDQREDQRRRRSSNPG